MAGFAFEIEHRVDHVLDDLGTRQLAFLGNMADQDHGGALGLGEVDQELRAGPQLGDGAGSGLQQGRPHGLDRIDHDHVGAGPGLERGQNIAQIGFDAEREGGVRKSETLRAQADLRDRLLAGKVDHLLAAPAERRERLQQKGRLSDAGVAADNDRGSRHQAAAGDPVEFLDPGDDPRRHRVFAFKTDQFDQPALGHRGPRRPADARGGAGFLGDRVPRTAAVATAGPLGTFRAAALADEFLSGTSHCLALRG